MCDDLLELNDTELNHINFGDKTDSDSTSNDSDEDFVPKNFRIVRSFWGFFNQRYFALKTHFVFPNVKLLCCFLSETFVLYICYFSIAENVNIVGITFLYNCKYLQI